MEIGSSEWLKQHAEEITRESDAKLMKIAEDAVKRYKTDQIELDQQEVARFAMAFTEIQHQSFMLGIQTGLETARKIISSNATTPAD